MIHVSVPLRLPIAGGGTDLPEYFQVSGAELLIATIDQRIYVDAMPRCDGQSVVASLENSFVRPIPVTKAEGLIGCILRAKYPQGANITIKSNIDAGTGLGGSGSLAVALVAALDAFEDGLMSREDIALTAYKIERYSFGASVGLQDHVAAAFGGFIRLKISPTGGINVIEEQDMFVKFKAMVNNHGLLFDTGVRRSAQQVLYGISKSLQTPSSTALHSLTTISNLLSNIEDAIRREAVSDLGNILNEHWIRKRTMHNQMSSIKIDRIYEEAIKLGVYGGKLLGAGGGGYLLFFAPSELRSILIEKLQVLGTSYQPFDLDENGFCLTKYNPTTSE